MGTVKGINDYSIGLVLAGGGAKGAYEAGVFKALYDMEIVSQIKVISGTSVGAVNALLLAMNDGSIIDESWNSISYSRFIANEEKTRTQKLSHIIDKVRGNEGSILEQLSLNDMGLLSQSGIRRFIKDYVDASVVKKNHRTIYACAYDIAEDKPEYFKLNNCNEEEIIDRVLASCAIPFIFKPIVIEGKKYADGGIHSPEYRKGNVDNVPLEPLKKHNCDLIIVVHLSYKNSIDRKGFPENNIVEIFPSSPLEIINGIGGLTISSGTLKSHIDMGYRDAMVTLAPVIMKILRGHDISGAMERIDTYNENLVLENQHRII